MPGRILVVDDEASLRHLFRYTLQAEGSTVIECASGREALERLSNDRFDLIILDQQLPDLAGTQVLRSLRSRGLTTPVVFVTAYGNRELMEEANRLDCAAFLHKPVTPRELRQVAASALARTSQA